jgi:hypothetical protein
MATWTKARLRIAFGGCAVLLVSGAVLPASAQQASVAEQSSLVEKSARPTGPTYQELPDSPGVTFARLQPPDPVQSSSAPSQGGQSSGAPAQPAPAQSAPAQPIQAAPQPATPKPEGTAAAGANPATGVAASQPAGMAIAPAKQHRTRTLVLRTGAILGAGVALGSVIALTQGTSSKPPGAR